MRSTATNTSSAHRWTAQMRKPDPDQLWAQSSISGQFTPTSRWLLERCHLAGGARQSTVTHRGLTAAQPAGRLFTSSPWLPVGLSRCPHKRGAIKPDDSSTPRLCLSREAFLHKYTNTRTQHGGDHRITPAHIPATSTDQGPGSAQARGPRPCQSPGNTSNSCCR